MFTTLMDLDPLVMPIRAKVDEESGEIVIPLTDALAGIAACGLLLTRVAQADAAAASDEDEKQAILITALMGSDALKGALEHFQAAQTCAQVNL